MAVYIPALSDLCHDPLQPFHIRNPTDGPKRIRVRGLHPDLQLHKSGPHGMQQLQLLFVQDIRGDFKVKISDAIVIIPQILPDCHGVGMIAVKGSVYKLHLFYPGIQEKLQFFFYRTDVPDAH